MINKEDLERIVEKILSEDTDKFDSNDLFFVESKISADNRITVEIDSLQGVKVDDCARLSRIIESKLDREKEDFELTVSSAGLDKPLRVLRQYHKNIGRMIELRMLDGKFIRGKLIDVNEKEIELEQKQKKNKDIKNRLKLTDIKEAKVVITF